MVSTDCTMSCSKKFRQHFKEIDTYPLVENTFPIVQMLDFIFTSILFLIYEKKRVQFCHFASCTFFFQASKKILDTSFNVLLYVY